MRQVDLPEVEWLLSDGLRELPASVTTMLVDRRQDVQQSGRDLAAKVLARRLARLEILSTAPKGHGFRQPGEPGGARLIE